MDVIKRADLHTPSTQFKKEKQISNDCDDTELFRESKFSFPADIPMTTFARHMRVTITHLSLNFVEENHFLYDLILFFSLKIKEQNYLGKRGHLNSIKDFLLHRQTYNVNNAE